VLTVTIVDQVATLEAAEYYHDGDLVDADARYLAEAVEWGEWLERQGVL